MESKQALKRWMPILVALVVFVVINLFYFAPQFDGKVLAQHDILQYKGSVEDIMQHRAKYGEDPQWEGNMFSGMPAYLINVAYPAQLVKRTVGQVVKIIDTPAGFLFFAMVSMWLMLLIVGINPWVGIVAFYLNLRRRKSAVAKTVRPLTAEEKARADKLLSGDKE